MGRTDGRRRKGNGSREGGVRRRGPTRKGPNRCTPAKHASMRGVEAHVAPPSTDNTSPEGTFPAEDGGQASAAAGAVRSHGSKVLSTHRPLSSDRGSKAAPPTDRSTTMCDERKHVETAGSAVATVPSTPRSRRKNSPRHDGPRTGVERGRLRDPLRYTIRSEKGKGNDPILRVAGSMSRRGSRPGTSVRALPGSRRWHRSTRCTATHHIRQRHDRKRDWCSTERTCRTKGKVSRWSTPARSRARIACAEDKLVWEKVEGRVQVPSFRQGVLPRASCRTCRSEKR